MNREECLMACSALDHKTPSRVAPDACFHIRVRIESRGPRLTDPKSASIILAAAKQYHDERRWFLHLLVIMPDHLHLIASFPQAPAMSHTVGAWKSQIARVQRVVWQHKHFEHRLKTDGEFAEKADYVRTAPVREGLCSDPADWPWKLDGLL
jgi:putative transposase